MPIKDQILYLPTVAEGLLLFIGAPALALNRIDVRHFPLQVLQMSKSKILTKMVILILSLPKNIMDTPKKTSL